MASGDYVCTESVTGTLTTAQRTSLGTLLGQLWPGALADLTDVTFFRNKDNTISYSLSGDRTYTPTTVPVGSHIKSKVP